MSTARMDISQMSADERRDLLRQMVREKRSRQRSEFPLSYGQRGLWYFHKRAPASAAYNISFAVRLFSRIESEALRETLKPLLDRHPLLRATVREDKGEVMLAVHPQRELDLRQVDTHGDDEEQLYRRVSDVAHLPFDLERGPLFRATVFNRSEAECILLFSVHHIVADFWSLIVLISEFRKLYSARCQGQSVQLPPLRFQYSDFVRWQRELVEGPKGEVLWNYWSNRLAGDLPSLAMPTDRPWPRVWSFAGAAVTFQVDEATTTTLKELARKEWTTLFVVLLAAYQVLLSRYSGQSEVLVGSVCAGRGRPEFEGIVGYFANMVALRGDLSDDPPFVALVRQLRSTVLAALEHQDYPLALLVERLRPSRDAHRAPLFQATFVLESSHLLEEKGTASGWLGRTDSSLGLGSVKMKPFPIQPRATPFEIMLLAEEADNRLFGRLEYSTDLFDEPTMQAFLGCFQELLGAIARDPTRAIGAINLLSDKERQTVTLSAPVTATAPSADSSLHQLVEAQAERTPDAPALVWGRQLMTYGELNERASTLAGRLSALGVGPGVVVAVCLERSPELVVGLLGVLKAGGAFLPLPPEFPKKELCRMLKAAGAPVLLTRSDVAAALSDAAGPIVCLDSAPAAVGPSGPRSLPRAAGDHPACVHFLSDRLISTEHDDVVRRLQWLQHEIRLTASDVCTHHASVGCYAAVREIFAPLICGGRVVISGPASEYNSEDLRRLITEHNVSIVHLTPSELSALLDCCRERPGERLTSLRHVICSGEPLPTALVGKFFQVLSCELRYLYGPPQTGGELLSQVCRSDGDGERILAGRPTTMPVLILDKDLQLVPQGVVGEICIPGQGLPRLRQSNPVMPSLQHPTDASSTSQPRPFRTGEMARRLTDGAVQLVRSVPRHVWFKGYYTNLEEIEAVLSQDPTVADCAVLARESHSCTWELVAYVVCNSPLAPTRLKGRLEAELPPYLVPSLYISVAAVPLSAEGQVDERALEHLEVIDAPLLREFEKHLGSLPGVEDTAVLVTEESEAVPRVHFSELLPREEKNAEASPLTAPRDKHAPGSPPRESGATQRPAFCDGGPLVIDEQAPRTIGQSLLRTAEARGDKGIVLAEAHASGPERLLSYAALREEALRILTGLRNEGLKPRDRVILQLDSLRAFFPAFWACILAGIQPATVMVPPFSDSRRTNVQKVQDMWELLDHETKWMFCRRDDWMVNTWELLDRPTIITSGRLDAPFTEHCRRMSLSDPRVLSVASLLENPMSDEIHPCRPEEVAFLQLTPDNDGVPKCVPITHRGIVCHIHSLQQFCGYTADDVTLNWQPMDHPVALLMLHIKDAYLGCQQIQIATDDVLADPCQWLDLIDRHRVTRTWSPGCGYKLVVESLADAKVRNWDLSCVKSFGIGDDQATMLIAEEFLSSVAPYGVPHRAMQPSYGMAELCSAVAWQRKFELEEGRSIHSRPAVSGNASAAESRQGKQRRFVDLGPPVPGVQIRVVDEGNQPLWEGDCGRLQVRGDVVSPGYHKSPVATRKAFVGDGWFDTGDLAIVREGRLTVTGRDEIIIMDGAQYHCAEIEQLVDGIPGVEPTYVGACGVNDGRFGAKALAVFFAPSSGLLCDQAETVRAVKTKVEAELGAPVSHVVPLAREEFPRTTTGNTQRSQLRRRFEAGDFKKVLHDLEVSLGADETMPAWFYRRVWRPRAASPALPLPTGPFLLLLDQMGLGERLKDELRRAGRRCITIGPGERFSQTASDCFHIDLKDPDQYRQVLSLLAASDDRPTEIVHLCRYAQRRDEIASLRQLAESQDRGVYSLLYLVQALAGQRTVDQQVRLYAVTSLSQPILPQEQVAWENATMGGFLKTVSQELPWLHCRHVDLQPDRLRTNVAQLLRELRLARKELEVAYRQGRRLVPALARVDMAREPMFDCPIKRGGVYLLTGGLGETGTALAELLMGRYQARLILVGRTSLPDKTHWAEHLAQETEISGRIRNALLLDAVGGEYVFEAADCADLAALRGAVTRAEATWQARLAGVFHLAEEGTEPWPAADRAVTDETRDNFERAFRAKVYGTWAVQQLVSDRTDALFVAFSSVDGTFGAATRSASSAASSFLDYFSLDLYNRGYLGARCLAWCKWNGDGMSEASARPAFDANRNRGFPVISKQQALHSILAALHRGQTWLAVGLDEGNPQLRRHLACATAPAQRVTAFLAGRGDNLLSTSGQPTLRDRFGKSCQCRFLQVDAIPRRTDGTVDREELVRLAGREAPGSARHVPPRTELERQIVAIWEQLLQVREVGIYDNFFELGGHSVLAAAVLARLAGKIQRELPLEQLFEQPTVANLAALIEAGRQQAPLSSEAPPHRIDRSGSLPLSFVQQHLLSAGDPPATNPYHNIAVAIRILGPLDIATLKSGLRQLIARHENLRTSFAVVEGHPGLQILVEVGIELQIIDVTAREAADQELQIEQAVAEEAQRPFELSSPPLLRAGLLRLGPADHILVLTTHRLVADGWSMAVLVGDLVALYDALRTGKPAPLKALPVQYVDYAAWLRSRLSGDFLDRHKAYWKRQLDGVPLRLELPTDRPRPAVRRFRGAYHPFVVPDELSYSLRERCRQQKVTLFMMLLAALQALLGRLTGQDRFCVGSPVGGRMRPEFESLVGHFMNTVVLRGDLSGSPSFEELLGHVRETAVGAFAHQDLPFEHLVEHLQVPHDPGRNPLFQVMLVLENFPMPEFKLPDLTFLPVRREAAISRYDMSLYAMEISNRLTGWMIYDVDLFDSSTIEHWTSQFIRLLETVAADPTTRIDALPLDLDTHWNTLAHSGGKHA